ncbi:PREDICTED: zinc finger CCCH domain-containing protein 46-like [Tarenaya hassleriana]|uniref:zinc finger CCCH domain-containing protein 46-like n=1 Tax=Tarenaya hassleriana TaxID=28532 RepID=UPI00053C91B5|nr:PREDICTED: zinc finger CCCH domain-containing protein 46-like [Tarenaya hassleriana]XP_010557832.1 PREDICTED: zinc finger CCCH domain-containing protein 46-like [Tarenaya hassleriana]
MDDYEATRTVFSRIQSLDPENASKIMGFLLLQDHAEKEMIRLAFGPEALVHSVILKAKKDLALSLPNVSSSSTSPPTPSTPSSPSPFLTNPRQSSFPSRVFSANIPPLTIPNNSSSSSSSSSPDLPNQDILISPSNGGGSSLNPASLPFYGNGGGASCDVMDDFTLQDHLSFLNDNDNSNSSMNSSVNLVSPRSSSDQLFYSKQPDLSSSPPSKNGYTITDSMLSPHFWASESLHKRSFSVSDVLGSEDSTSGLGGGWRPCLYYARGYCKNGSSCRFVHGDPAGGFEIGSPNKIENMEQSHELLRSKSASHHQRFPSASQLIGGSSFPYSPKGINFLLQQQQNETQRAAVAAALAMDEDLHRFGRSRLERSDYSAAAMGSPASRQIYLTFPADSTFKEDDVSNYFSLYGPVQDVRIPYQQKRMFGFVTFMYPETVKIILAKGNPHFVCDARVLVKPYKEKGKVPDKFRNKQHMDRPEFVSPCGTPTALDSRDPFDLHLGARMLYNNNQDIWRRKLEEQSDLQQALELQNRRLMNLQLLDVKKLHHHRTLSTGSPIPSPTHLQSPNFFNQCLALSPFSRCQESFPLGSMNSSSEIKQTDNGFSSQDSSRNKDHIDGKDNPPLDAEIPRESLDHNLPDSPFASPTKASFAGKFISAFGSGDQKESENNNNSTNAMDTASFKSYNCQMPRFSSGHGSIGMYTGNGGPTCPVGIR